MGQNSRVLPSFQIYPLVSLFCRNVQNWVEFYARIVKFASFVFIFCPVDLAVFWSLFCFADELPLCEFFLKSWHWNSRAELEKKVFGCKNENYNVLWILRELWASLFFRKSENFLFSRYRWHQELSKFFIKFNKFYGCLASNHSYFYIWNCVS